MSQTRAEHQIKMEEEIETLHGNLRAEIRSHNLTINQLRKCRAELKECQRINEELQDELAFELPRWT